MCAASFSVGMMMESRITLQVRDRRTRAARIAEFGWLPGACAGIPLHICAQRHLRPDAVDCRQYFLSVLQPFGRVLGQHAIEQTLIVAERIGQPRHRGVHVLGYQLDDGVADCLDDSFAMPFFLDFAGPKP